jgi:two-component system heavy metal sensor histidine kinase CusS
MSSKNAPEQPAATWSLAARLTAWYVGSAFLLILLATGFLYWALITNLDREDDQLLRDKIHVLGTILREEAGAATALEREVELETGAGRRVPVFLRVLDPKGAHVLETPGMSDRLPASLFPEPGPIQSEPGPGREIETPDGQAYRVLAARLPADSARESGYLIQAALDRTYEEDLLAGYRRDLGIVLGIALGVCALAGYQIVRRCLQPVNAMAERVQGIQPTTLNERLPVAGLPAELSVLAGRFNAMLDRLEDSFSRLARFSADIAHELRTPVNNLRGEVEVALGKPRSLDEYREVLGSALEECGRLTRIIDSLLFLARAESPQARVAGEPLDVGQELATVRDFYEVAAAEKGVTLEVMAAEGIVAALDRTLLQRAVGNLVANALDHTPAGGVVTLTARATGPEVVIEVADTGCGIPPEHLPHIFDRFYRVDQARTNASGRVGLGLAIVQSIAALHQGTVSIASRPQQGTCVTLTFPVPSTKMTTL